MEVGHGSSVASGHGSQPQGPSRLLTLTETDRALVSLVSRGNIQMVGFRVGVVKARMDML